MSFSMDNAMAAIRSQFKNIETEDLETILKSVQIPGPKGPQGDPGRDAPKVRDGKDGSPGKDAPTPEFLVGSVVFGDAASVTLKRDKNNVLVFSFVLPRGKQGDPSQVPGPTGPRGFAGKDGASAEQPNEIQLAIAVKKVLEASPDKYRGERGESIKGESIKGEKGDPGMSRQEIIQVLIETLQTTGVLTESQEKLLRIRAKLRAAINEADSRSQFTISKIVKEVDVLFDSDPEADAKRREQALRNENETLRKQLEEKKP
jgi:hypothetical protein